MIANDDHVDLGVETLVNIVDILVPERGIAELKYFVEVIDVDGDETGDEYYVEEDQLSLEEDYVESEYEFSFKVGDIVKVVNEDENADDSLGKEVKITKRGFYAPDECPGYHVSPKIGNTEDGSYRGFISEDSFELVKKGSGHAETEAEADKCSETNCEATSSLKRPSKNTQRF